MKDLHNSSDSQIRTNYPTELNLPLYGNRSNGLVAKHDFGKIRIMAKSNWEPLHVLQPRLSLLDIHR